MASIISYKDLNTLAYWACISGIHPRSKHHLLPKKLSRRIREYCHRSVSRKAAPDEARRVEEVSKLLISGEVRKNDLFEGAPLGA